MNRKLGTLLILMGVLLGGGALARGLYFAPNDEYVPEIPHTQGTVDQGTVEQGNIEEDTVEEDSGLVASTEKAPPSTQKVGLPSRLIIEKIGVNTKVLHLGVTSKGNMAAPGNFTDAGWYKYGTVPGELGSAVISAHVDNALGTPAVFYNLKKLEIGDKVQVVDAQGKRLTFQVVAKEIQPYNLKGPALERIFNAKGKARLNLITCAGTWLASAKTNDKRLVIYTELVS